MDAYHYRPSPEPSCSRPHVHDLVKRGLLHFAGNVVGYKEYYLANPLEMREEHPITLAAERLLPSALNGYDCFKRDRNSHIFPRHIEEETESALRDLLVLKMFPNLPENITASPQALGTLQEQSIKSLSVLTKDLDSHMKHYRSKDINDTGRADHLRAFKNNIERLAESVCPSLKEVEAHKKEWCIGK